jgi:hypothetical protein
LVNTAQQQFVIDSKCLWKDWAATIAVSGTASYALPTDFMFEKKVTFDGIGLIPKTRQQLESLYRSSDWSTVTGTPVYYVVDPDVDKSQLLLVPIPQANDAGKAIVLTYYPRPTDLSADADIPFNSTPLLAQFHIALAAWTAWMQLMGESETTPSIERKRNNLLKLYNDTVSQATDTFGNTVSAPIRMMGVRAY